MQWQGDDLLLYIVIQPKSSRDEIIGPVIGEQGTRLKIKITAPPIDGKANSHLIKFLAKTCGVARSHIKIESGDSQRNKRIRIQSPNKTLTELEKFIQ